MAIVSKPAVIQKNVAAEFTLSKSELAQVSSVANDTYFGNTANWKEVILYYKSNPAKQREILKFDATQESPTANFLVSDRARDVFEVQKIVIKDFDEDSMTVERSELVAAEFDISFV